MAPLKTLLGDGLARAVMLGRAGAWRSTAVLASGVASGLLRTLSVLPSKKVDVPRLTQERKERLTTIQPAKSRIGTTGFPDPDPRNA